MIVAWRRYLAAALNAFRTSRVKPAVTKPFRLRPRGRRGRAGTRRGSIGASEAGSAARGRRSAGFSGCSCSCSSGRNCGCSCSSSCSCCSSCSSSCSNKTSCCCWNWSWSCCGSNSSCGTSSGAGRRGDDICGRPLRRRSSALLPSVRALGFSLSYGTRALSGPV